MDVRDVAFWKIQAQKKMLEDQIKRLQAARSSVALDADYAGILGDLTEQLREIEHGTETVVRQNWQDLKRIGGGRA